ncbi:MAG TPA: hypothetical protein VFJ58_15930 [Armatimonadota bacterium]|nr:hypothetical protein [Armatimonadota bacterium]
MRDPIGEAFPTRVDDRPARRIPPGKCLSIAIALLFAYPAMASTQSATPITGRSQAKPILSNAAVHDQPAAPVEASLIIYDSGEARAGASTAIYDFGAADLLVRPRIDRSFFVRNDHNFAVTLTEVRSSCGCTTAVLGGSAPVVLPLKLAPHTQVELHATIDLRPLPSGTVDKSIWIYTAGQYAPAASIEIRGSIESQLYFIPSLLNFGKVRRGHSRSLIFSLRYESDLWPPGKPPHLLCSNPNVRIKPLLARPIRAPEAAAVLQSPVSRAGGSTTLAGRVGAPVRAIDQAYLAILKGSSSSGAISARISVSPEGSSATDPSVIAEAILPILADVRGDITASPEAVAFGAVTRGRGGSQAITLDVASDAAAMRAICGSRYLTVTLLAGSSSQGASKKSASGRRTAPNDHSADTPDRVTLSVTISPKAPTGVFKSKITLTTAPGVSLIIPVSAYVLAP